MCPKYRPPIDFQRRRLPIVNGVNTLPFFFSYYAYYGTTMAEIIILFLLFFFPIEFQNEYSSFVVVRLGVSCLLCKIEKVVVLHCVQCFHVHPILSYPSFFIFYSFRNTLGCNLII